MINWSSQAPVTHPYLFSAAKVLPSLIPPSLSLNPQDVPETEGERKEGVYFTEGRGGRREAVGS